MKKLLIILGSIAGVLLLVLLVGVYYLASFDANSHKQQITQMFFNSTGRQLQLDGDISVTIYPWLGFSVDQLSITNAPGFSQTPLLAVQHAQMRLKLLALLHDEIEIDTVRLSGVRANLEVAANGSNNWTFANNNTSDDDATTDTQSTMSLNKLVIGGVDIRDTNVVYDNLANNSHYAVDNLDVAIGELSYGKPLTLTADLHATAREPELQAALKLSGTALYDSDKGIYQLDPFKIDTTLTGPTVPGGSTAITFTTAVLFDSNKHSLTLPQFELNALDTRISGDVALGNMNSGKPSLATELHGSSQDVSVFFRILGQEQVAAQLRSLDNKMDLNVSIDANLQSGEVHVPTLQASLLGFTLNGNVTSSNLHDGKSDLTGTITLKNDNLRELMKAFDQQGIAASMQALAVNINVGGNSKVMQLSPFTINMEFADKGSQQLQVVADTEVNLDNSSLHVKQFSLKGAGINASGELSAKDFASKLSYEGKLSLPQTNIRQVVQQLQLPALTMSDTTTLQKVSAQAEFTGTASRFDLQKLTVELDDSHITGNARIDNLATLQGGFAIDIDTINADRYMAPSTAVAKSDDIAPPKPLDVEQLRKLNLQGTINVGLLTFSGLKLSKIQLPLQSGKGLINLNPIAASLYGGSFNGGLALDVSGAMPIAKLNTTLVKVDMGALLQDFMQTKYLAGIGNVELTLEARGKDTPSLKHNLNGSGKLLLDNGVLRGVDIGASLTAIETMIRSKSLVSLNGGGETRFNNFASTLAIKDSVVNTNDLLIKAPGWQVSGTGTLADLRRDAFDFDLVASVDPTTATVADQKYDIGGHKLPISCKGSFSNPRCLPDAAAILKDAAAKPARELLDKALKRFLR